ncbi:hypothetical protein JYU34_010315 [Plutella xylostella]|uniref:FP protein C-terminal domain-containing protein n=1 Tax=Plutella xylostella TaxID=51655 RepID=A0ABQ7Q8Z7_PLUXY|nr:hypothetical protein JYU34_022521 [Plutella xylostella]KAG7301708.1 hypothetical protein JYU34_014690 [Plutella xylostella]KAG7304916.1 hypothetical protein JYU34_010315 [Plutella xylostella]
MVSCGKCSEDVTFGALCSKCMMDYHYQCSGVTEKSYSKLSERNKATWVCITCKNDAAGPSAAPAASTARASAKGLSLENVMEEFHKLNAKLSPLVSLVDDIRGIKADVKELKKASSDTSTQFKKIDDRLTNVEKRQESIDGLKEQLSRLQRNVDDKEQWLRSNNAEIKGVPQKHGENLFEIISAIGIKIGYTVVKSSINYVARVPSRDAERSKPIIVAFSNRYVKEDFVAAARAANHLTAADINLQGSNKIFVNDHLTVQNKQLLSKAKVAAKEFGFEHVWVKHSKILVRKNSTSNVIKIRNEQDLHKIHS